MCCTHSSVDGMIHFLFARYNSYSIFDFKQIFRLLDDLRACLITLEGPYTSTIRNNITSVDTLYSCTAQSTSQKYRFDNVYWPHRRRRAWRPIAPIDSYIICMHRHDKLVAKTSCSFHQNTQIRNQMHLKIRVLFTKNGHAGIWPIPVLPDCISITSKHIIRLSGHIKISHSRPSCSKILEYFSNYISYHDLRSVRIRSLSYALR